MEASALRPLSSPWAGPLRGRTSDERLVAALRAGRTAAFNTIYDRYSAPLLSFCRHMLGSREEAEDAVQHTFAAAYTNLCGSEKSIQLRPWLYAIARNHCVSLLRARRQHVSIDDVEPAVEGLAPAVARREDLRELLRDLARLPEDQRAALLLAELGALSHDEIAEVVGCRPGKVKALVFQARSSLAAGREARETPCNEIREQLASLTGGSLLRTGLRRHLRDCEGCSAFRAEVKRQRSAMAVLLPVVPSAALKSGVMSAISAKAGAGGGAGLAAGGGAAATGGGVGAALTNAGAAKLLVAGAVALAGAGGTVTAVSAIDSHSSHGSRTVPQSYAGPSGTATGAAASASGLVAPRAYGIQAPGRLLGGVANGHNPKGVHGHSGTAPGQTGATPGLAGTAPGKSGLAPGQLKPKTHGNSGSAPGHTKTGGNAGGRHRAKTHGNSGSAPGHTRTGTKARPHTNSGGGSSGQGSSGQTGNSGSSGSGNVVDKVKNTGAGLINGKAKSE
jgi:RNA polymerase sigma factor (sigma-70 family)